MEAQTHKIALPLSVITVIDLSRVGRELELLDEFMVQSAIRTPGTPMQLPRLSKLLDDVAAFLRLPESRHVKVDIDERTSRELVRAVRDGVASLGVCWDNVDFEGLGHQPYRTDQLAVLVHRDHPLAGRGSLRFEQTLDHDHVGLPPNTAVQGMLQRAAARCGRSVSWRVVVSNFDAALRVVAANLSISVIPYQVFRSNPKPEVVAIPLTDPWARRRFAICYRDRDTLQPAAARMLEFLGARAEAVGDTVDAGSEP